MGEILLSLDVEILGTKNQTIVSLLTNTANNKLQRSTL